MASLKARYSGSSAGHVTRMCSKTLSINPERLLRAVVEKYTRSWRVLFLITGSYNNRPGSVSPYPKARWQTGARRTSNFMSSNLLHQDSKLDSRSADACFTISINGH